jgi:hypothetical protein
MQGGKVPNSLAISYTSTLTLVPIADALDSWQADHDALAAALSLAGTGATALPAEHAQRRAQSLGTVRVTAPAPPLGRDRSALPHCLLPGVLCNAGGRVAYLDGAAAGMLGGKEGRGAGELLRALLGMPWLAALSVPGLALKGMLPRFADLDQMPALVRLLHDMLLSHSCPFKRMFLWL